MPICQKCHYKWSWKETFVRLFTFSTKLTCPSCNQDQYISKNARNRLSLTIFPFVIWIPLFGFNVSNHYILLLQLVLCVVLIIVMPFFYQLSNKDEPMW
ncbi:TIGR04104 family putative zinc finger protein [Bacillus spongiae]|uniref:TIGR04104 family putative zinc finger protein n=1 Tax=Bacillus spongiae TaxID=2683610 RepID=A0ABU8HFM1_9BACI